MTSYRERGCLDHVLGRRKMPHPSNGRLFCATFVLSAIRVRFFAVLLVLRGDKMTTNTTKIAIAKDYLALTKPRITWLILVTTAVGYFFGE